MSALGSIERLYDLEPSLDEFRAAVIAGLSRPQKTLPCKFFYDGEGSRLFDQICALPEYYPTRTELLILEQRASTIARLMGSRVRLVEFGSGAGIKIRLLLRALNQPAAYVPVDISRQRRLHQAVRPSGDSRSTIAQDRRLFSGVDDRKLHGQRGHRLPIPDASAPWSGFPHDRRGRRAERRTHAACRL